FRRCRPWLLGAAMAVAFVATAPFSFAEATPGVAATAPAPAAPATPAADPIGFSGGPTSPLFTPTAWTSGWVTGVADKNLNADAGGTWKPFAGEKITPEETTQHLSKL